MVLGFALGAGMVAVAQELDEGDDDEEGDEDEQNPEARRYGSSDSPPPLRRCAA